MFGRLKRVATVVGALGFVAVVFGWFPRLTPHLLWDWDLRLAAGEERVLDLAVPGAPDVVVNGWFHMAWWNEGYRDYGEVSALDAGGKEIRTFERWSGPFSVTGPVARLKVTARGAPARVRVRVLRTDAAEDLLWSERLCKALLLVLLIPFLSIVVRALSRWTDRDRSTRHLRRRIGEIGVVIVSLPILHHIVSAILTRVEYPYGVPGAVRWPGSVSGAVALWASAGVMLAFASLERRAIGGRLLELRASLRSVLPGALFLAAVWLLWRLLPDAQVRGPWWRLDSTKGFPAEVLMALSAGICEEIIFRGFLLTRIRELTDSAVLALIVTTVMFSLVHVYDGEWHAFHAGVFGLLAGIVTLRTRNLYPAIWAHAAWDILAAVGMGYNVVRGFA